MLTHELIGRLSIMCVYTACTYMHEGHLYIHELIEGCMYIQQVPPPIDTYRHTHAAHIIDFTSSIMHAVPHICLYRTS